MRNVGPRWYILTHETHYLKSEIECGDCERAKRALQSICKSYRHGGSITPGELNGFENAILGALHSDRSDEKVRRWSLSAISQLGRHDISWTAVLSALTKYSEEPQVVSAAIAALFKLEPSKAQNIIETAGEVSLEILTLSALQTTHPSRLNLSDFKIDIDKADAVTLQLALVLVGMDKSPENIFHPQYSNREIVKVLGGHHEPLISQYSAWATAESPHLTAADLGINLRLLDRQPENVRSYVYRLYAAEPVYSDLQHELILIGIDDPSKEARLGLSIGLLDTYYDGLDTTAIHWLYDEGNEDVRDYILDHIVKQSMKSETYKKTSVEFYCFARSDSRKRRRMEAAAERTDLYRDFKLIMHEEDEGLFGTLRSQHVTNNTFNNYGNVQGQTSMSGTAVNSGNQKNALAVNEIVKARETLEHARFEIEQIPLSEALRAEINEAIGSAQEQPTKDKLATAVTTLKKAETAAGSIAGTAESVLKIGRSIAVLVGLYNS